MNEKPVNFKKRHQKIGELLFDMRLEQPLRNVQKDALKWFDNRDRKRKITIIEAATGSGKSYIILNMIKRFKELNRYVKTDILTASRALQQQYVDDYEYIDNIWGKSNYQCSEHKTTCDKGSLINKSKKTQCECCPYADKKSKWLDSTIALTNFHTMGMYAIFQNEFLTEVKKSEKLIIDECHLLEPLFNSFVSFQLSNKTWKSLLPTDVKTDFEHKLISLNSLEECKKFIKDDLITALDKSKVHNLLTAKSAPGTKKFDESLKNLSSIEELSKRLERFLTESNMDEWIFDKKNIKYEMTIDIKPLWTGKIIKTQLFDIYSEVILLSATIGDIDVFCKLNGIDRDDVNYLSLPSTFPVENRPIYTWGVGKMTFNSKLETWKKMVPVIKQLLTKYKGKKGIIHTNSFELLSWIERDIRDKRLIIAKPSNGMVILEEHKSSTTDSVLVSPSFSEGISLDDDLARFAIIIKIPYPDLSDKVNKKRLEENPSWYTGTTVNKIVQTIGRGIRSEVDKCDTIILDSSIYDILKYNSNMFPEYILESIKKIE